MNEQDNYTTSSALLEQLVYIDNFMSSSSTGDLTPNLDIDGQLSMDLAAFADDSFIFPDEDKPKNTETEFEHKEVKEEPNLFLNKVNVSELPKFPVPPGAKSSLESAGLSQNQIDLLSALIAQHQTSLGNTIPPSATEKPVVPHLLSQAGPQFTPVRQHNQIQGLDRDFLYRNESSVSSGNLNSPIQASPNSSEDTPSHLYESGSRTTSSELDKRRRNTAASARFRIKKKMKEKQMENQLNTLQNLIKDYEGKVQQLEMENKLLRNLIVVKGTQKSDNELKLLRERAKLGLESS